VLWPTVMEARVCHVNLKLRLGSPGLRGPPGDGVDSEELEGPGEPQAEEPEEPKSLGALALASSKTGRGIQVSSERNLN
jgi:hypothetical protein